MWVWGGAVKLKKVETNFLEPIFDVDSGCGLQNVIRGRAWAHLSIANLSGNGGSTVQRWGLPLTYGDSQSPSRHN